MILVSWGPPRGPLAALLGLLGGILGRLLAVLERLEAILDRLGKILGELGRLLDPLGPSWRSSWTILGKLSLEAILEAILGVWEADGAPLWVARVFPNG